MVSIPNRERDLLRPVPINVAILPALNPVSIPNRERDLLRLILDSPISSNFAVSIPNRERDLLRLAMNLHVLNWSLVSIPNRERDLLRLRSEVTVNFSLDAFQSLIGSVIY